MKKLFLFSLTLMLNACGFSQVDYRQQSQAIPTSSEMFQKLQQVNWQSGAQDCEKAKLPPLQTYEFNTSTFILRQNKCSHFEAPFMMLLIGETQAVLIDSGASDDPQQVPIYDTIKKLLLQNEQTFNRKIAKVTVVHSHSHQDHYQGDTQFSHDPLFSIVGTSAEAVVEHFRFNQNSLFQYDLGNRKLTIFAIPGHQQQSIAIYDHQTQWLISGDTFYPGQIYVRDWQDYRESIKKIWQFSATHKIDAIIGTHIEMSQTAGEIYPIGSTYQPKETYLPMSLTELQQLNEALDLHQQPTELIFNRFIVTPMSTVQKGLSSVVKFFVE